MIATAARTRIERRGMLRNSAGGSGKWITRIRRESMGRCLLDFRVLAVCDASGGSDCAALSDHVCLISVFRSDVSFYYLLRSCSNQLYS